MLTSISGELTNSADPYIQKSGRNIIKSYLEAAQETRDQQLLKLAYTIGKAALEPPGISWPARYGRQAARSSTAGKGRCCTPGRSRTKTPSPDASSEVTGE